MNQDLPHPPTQPHGFCLLDQGWMEAVLTVLSLGIHLDLDRCWGDKVGLICPVVLPLLLGCASR